MRVGRNQELSELTGGKAAPLLSALAKSVQFGFPDVKFCEAAIQTNHEFRKCWDGRLGQILGSRKLDVKATVKRSLLFRFCTRICKS